MTDLDWTTIEEGGSVSAGAGEKWYLQRAYHPGRDTYIYKYDIHDGSTSVAAADDSVASGLMSTDNGALPSESGGEPSTGKTPPQPTGGGSISTEWADYRREGSYTEESAVEALSGWVDKYGRQSVVEALNHQTQLDDIDQHGIKRMAAQFDGGTLERLLGSV